PDATQTPLATAQPPLINPHQYAEQLRAKAVAEKAAAVKTVKETYAAVRVGQQEVARAAAELKAAEAAHSLAQVKAETAAKAYQAAVAAASATEQESILVVELKDPDGNVYGMAESRSLSKGDERVAATTDAAAIATMNVEAALADATAKLEAAKTASAAKAADLADAVR